MWGAPVVCVAEIGLCIVQVDAQPVALPFLAVGTLLTPEGPGHRGNRESLELAEGAEELPRSNGSKRRRQRSCVQRYHD